MTDTERLDWLESQYAGENDRNYAFPVADPITHLWYIYSNDEASDVTDKRTLRDAIDTAMSQTIADADR